MARVRNRQCLKWLIASLICAVGVYVRPVSADLFYQTEQGQIRVEKIVEGLDQPWSFAFLENDGLLITIRAGELLVFRDGVLKSVANVPRVRAEETSGLLDVALSPEFDKDRLLVLTYNACSATTTLAGSDNQLVRWI